MDALRSAHIFAMGPVFYVRKWQGCQSSRQASESVSRPTLNRPKRRCVCEITFKYVVDPKSGLQLVAHRFDLSGITVVGIVFSMRERLRQ